MSITRLAALWAALWVGAGVGLAPAGAGAAISIGVESMLGGSGASGAPGHQIVLDSLGTLTPENEDGVAFWSLDNPTQIFQGGSQVARIDSWNSSFKVDPFVTNDVNLTNTSSLPLVYIVSVALNIPTFNYDEIISSSVGVTATDSNGNNSLLVQTDGPAFYRGRVDGVTKLTLEPPDLPLTTAKCSPFPNQAGCTATSSVGVASLPTPTDAADQIEIILRFGLSPGDSVGVTSRFEIVSNASVVPEPTTGLLLGLGVVVLAVVRRHR